MSNGTGGKNNSDKGTQYISNKTDNIVNMNEVTRSFFKPIFMPIEEPSEKVVTEHGTYHPRNALNNLTGKEWIHFTRSWFNLKPKKRNKKTGEILHPAKYPEELMARFIRFFTKKGMWVLDPFCGTASTLVAAEECERNAIGIELSEKWARIGAKRTQNYIIIGDSRNLDSLDLPQIDFSITSPPYWDMLHHSRGGSKSTQKDRIKAGFDATFSKHELDMGNIKEYNAFLNELLGLYNKLMAKMRQGAYIVVILQNIQKEKRQFYPLAWDFALKMREIGWDLRQEMLWCQSDKKLGIWGYPNTYISNVHHHYFLVIQKP